MSTPKHIALATKHGTEDARIFAAEHPEDIEACLMPGQLGADEGLINALQDDQLAKYLGLTLAEVEERGDAWHEACGAYSRAHLVELARIHAASQAGARAGSAKSKAKSKAARANGKKGGRPKGAKDSKPRTRQT